MSETPKKRQPADVLCAMCGQPVDECKVGGMHGMIRERARAAAQQLREKKAAK